jgi:copper transport protein
MARVCLAQRHRWPAFAPALLLVGLALLALASAAPAWAHATYVRSDPPSGGQLSTPGRIRVVFTEDVDAGFSELQVLDSARRRVDQRDTSAVQGDPKALVVSVPRLPDGTYTVAWKTLSAVDGHTIRGAFPLVVGEGGVSGSAEVLEAQAEPFETLLRAANFLGTLLLFGGLSFWGLVLTPSLRTLGARQRSQEQVEHDWELRLRRLGALLAGLLLVVNLLWLAEQVAKAADLPLYAVFGEPLVRYLTTRNGLIWIARTALLLALAGCLLGLSSPRLRLVGPLLTGLLMFTTSLTSHAAALPRGAELAVTIDWLHQVGGGLWLGSLAATLLLLPIALRADPERAPLLAAVVPRLSSLALVSVGLLVASGIFSTLVQVGRLEALDTLYGRALLFKIAALLPMLLLGLLNLLVFKPRFVRAAEPKARRTGESIAGLARRFRWSLVGEVALGVAILVATGVLTSVEPGREVWARQPRPVELASAAEDLRMTLRVEPGRVGENTFRLTVQDEAGQPAANVQRVQLRFDYLDQQLGRGTRLAEPQPDGSFMVTSSDLSVAGRWQIEAAVRRLDREDTVAAFRFEVGAPASETGGSAIPLPLFNNQAVPLALALLVAGLGFGLWVWRSPELRRAQRQRLSLACAIVALGSGLVLVRSANFGPDPRLVRNPIPASAASLAEGRQLYEQQGCVDCHGVSGRGDGPLGRTLRPRPADFRIHMAAGHTDGELFDWISNGVPGTAMPPYADRLTEEQRWHLINFIRGFGEGESADTPAPAG